MTPEQWRRISTIFHAARMRDRDEQKVFVAEACAKDRVLADEVNALLEADDTAGSPSTPGALLRSASLIDRPDVGAETTANEVNRTNPASANRIAFARGRYVVTRTLGEGGQKRVYLTYDTHLDRDVVIAVLRAGLFQGSGQARLELEARALARLGDHPHIVTVHDIGEEFGQPYIVTQFVDGGSLSALLGVSQHLPVKEAIRFGHEVCLALSYAHERGIIHRDVKPDNIWLTKDGVAKLGDFGLARDLDLSRLTAEGQLLGTVPYLSPEQALGQDAGPRADLYSLGVVLYELVAGRRPFIGDTVAAVISQHLHARPVAPSWHNPEVPSALDSLILRLLEKRPEDRPGTAEDVAEALFELLHDPAEPVVTRVARAARPLERLAGGVFVGRAGEMNELRSALHAALAGTGSVVQIIGEPGSGKTSLAEQLLTYAQLHGADILRSHCYESEGAPAYSPWVQLLRSYMSSRSIEHVLTMMGDGAPSIADLDGDIRKRFPDIPSAPVLEPEQARFRLFDSVTSTFTNASAVRPLVVLVEDLQWADATSLRLLQFLAREIRHARLLVIATLRPGKYPSLHPLAQTAGVLASQDVNRRILLQGLTEDEVSRFIEITIGGSASETLVRSVQRRTEGNPFFVKEVVRLLVADGRLGSSGDLDAWPIPLPQSVREVITRRLGQVSEDCYTILLVASVIGNEFDLVTLRRAADVAADQVLDALDNAIAALLVNVVTPAASYCFSHALIRDTLYESMSASQRMQLHRRIAVALLNTPPERIESLSGRLAFHFFEAIPLGEVDRAIHYAVQAARLADRFLAYEEAVGHYEMALRALEHQESMDEARRCELLFALGEVQMRAGLSEKGRESFTRVAEVARRNRAGETFALAVLGLSTGTPVGTKLGHAIDRVEIGRLEEALDGIPKADSELRARLLAQLALALYHQPDRRVALSLEAVEISRRLNHSPAVMAALYSRCVSLEGFDRAEERLALATEMVRTAETAGDVENALRGHYRCYRELKELGDADGVERQLKVYTNLANQIRQPRYLWYVPYCNASLSLYRGDFSTAERLAEQALVIGLRADDHNARLFCGLVKYSCMFHRGSFDEMEPMLRRLIDRYPSTIGWKVQLAQLYYLMGRRHDTRQLIEAIGGRDFDDLPIDGSYVITLGALASVLHYLGDVQRTKHLYQRLRPYAKFNQVAGNSAVTGAPVSDALGVASTTLGYWDDSVAYFEDALAAETRLGSRPWRAWTLCSYAQMLQARGQAVDSDRCATFLREARSIGLELGMRWVITWTEAQLSLLPAH